MAPFCFSDIHHILYINLKLRADRRLQMESELAKFGWLDKAMRFEAVEMPALGAIGCSISHLKCLQQAKQHGWSHVLILEDDVLFTDPELLKKHTDIFFTKMEENGDAWDVVLFSGNCGSPYQVMSDLSCVKVTKSLTTAAYLVNAHYYDILIQNISSGIKQLIEKKHMKQMYAIDVYWMQLQERDNWYLITPLTVTQRADYSNIENAYTNFAQHILTLH